jgi:Ca2+-binding EF-hand superfamily protein
LFHTYLIELFKDLSERDEKTMKKSIPKLRFIDYMKLPVFISEKLFSAFDDDNSNSLNLTEFSEHMIRLYIGNYEDCVREIFKIYDFNKDGYVDKGDVKILLSYLPLKTDTTATEYKYQIASLEEIDNILNVTFGKKNSINYKDFLNVIEFTKSDIIIQLLCFLYQKRPFTQKNIEMFKKFRRQSAVTEKIILSRQVNKRLLSPNRKSILNPVHNLFQLELRSKSPDVLDTKEKLNQKNSEILSGINGMVRMANTKLPNERITDEIVNKLKDAKNTFDSPTNFFRKSKQPVTNFSLE